MIQLTFAVRLGWYHDLLLKMWTGHVFFFLRNTYCMSTRFYFYTTQCFVHVYNIFFSTRQNPLFFHPGKACLFGPSTVHTCRASKLFTLPRPSKSGFVPLKKADHLLTPPSFLRVSLMETFPAKQIGWLQQHCNSDMRSPDWSDLVPPKVYVSRGFMGFAKIKPFVLSKPFSVEFGKHDIV